MDAQDWQAAAGVMGVLLVLINLGAAGFMYRMQAKFVTRLEHHALEDEVVKINGKLGEVEKQMSDLFTNEKADKLYDKLGQVERQNAELIGRLPGFSETINRFNHQLNLLLQNELSKGKRS